jgi:hypothetical protein
LPGRAFHAAAINQQQIIVLIAEKKLIVEINLKEKRVKEIHNISPGVIYNPKK